MKNPSINKRIIEIWNDEFGNSLDHMGPLFYGPFKKGGIAYSGLNPSFSDSAFKSFLKSTPFKNLNPYTFYPWGKLKKRKNFVDKCIEIDAWSQENYPLYFKRPKEIGKELNLPVQFLDLFQYRETNQEDFKEKIMVGRSLNDFGKKQMDLFFQMLEKTDPKVILIANGFGSDLFKEYFTEVLTWNEQRGFHLLNLNQKKVPIFFSSMLSGQRSLDRSSYERLKWHLRRAIS